MADVNSDERLAQWRGTVGRWRDSGVSGAAFCQDEGLREWQFRYWVKRIVELDDPGAGFARVAASGSGLRLALPGGLRLEVDPGFDDATLKRFLAALSPSC